MRLLLWVSLGLNLAVAGALVGSAIGGKDHRGPKAVRGAETAIGIYGRALDRSERKELGRAIRAKRGGGEGRELRAELRALAQDAIGVLRADPFEPAAFQDVLMRQKGVLTSRADRAQVALAEHVAKMTPEARAAYADRLEAAMSRGKFRRRQAGD